MERTEFMLGGAIVVAITGHAVEIDRVYPGFQDVQEVIDQYFIDCRGTLMGKESVLVPAIAANLFPKGASLMKLFWPA